MTRKLLVIVLAMACRDKKAPPPPPPAPADATLVAIDASIVDATPDAFTPVWMTSGAKELDEQLRKERDVLKTMAAFDDAQLRTLHGGWDCWFAMDAARLLAERGDRSLLPVRGGENDPERLARKLCLISTINEADKRRAYLAEYVAPKFETSYEECRDDLPPGTEDTHIKTKHTRAALTGKELRQFLINPSQPACRAGNVQGEFICGGDGPGQSLEVTFAPAANGKLYLSKIDGTRNSGCY